MDLNEDIANGNVIQAYQKNSITIKGVEYLTSLMLDKDNIKPIPEIALSEITTDLVKSFLETAHYRTPPTCLLIGVGEVQTSHPIQLIAQFQRMGIGCEIMTTPAACRTFNIMVADLRKVMAILLLANR